VHFFCFVVSVPPFDASLCKANVSKAAHVLLAVVILTVARVRTSVYPSIHPTVCLSQAWDPHSAAAWAHYNQQQQYTDQSQWAQHYHSTSTAAQVA
jgi:hypothetical protein